MNETILSSGEENSPLYFCDWLKRRRQELDLTQEQLAKRASCSVHAIRKIELGERRPSKQLAGLLAQSLEIPPEDRDCFIKVARGEQRVERLPSPARLSTGVSAPAVQPAPIPGNLPRALTVFFGREPELSTLGQLLSDPQCSLLTIAGPGGIGKTRLGIEAANQCKERFPDGAWFVSLAALNSPAHLVPAIADALHFQFQDPANPQKQLLHFLHDKRALLILDNAEHLLDGIDLLSEILIACPQVKLLVTSRERLNLLSEWVFEIQGLPVPTSERSEQFALYSSIALFVESARRVVAGFELQEADRRWVLKICQILEGMPLGIELAAAWVGVLPCEEIANEIERNFDFLAASMRDIPERQRSLRACIAYSWNLLSVEEQQFLSRMSVFHGSFSRAAAEAVCGADLAVLSSFRNKMLLYRNDQDLYHLHEIIRQYAALRLADDTCEDERVKDRHALYYAQRLSDWEKALKSSRQLETLTEMELEINNLRQAWQRMVTWHAFETPPKTPFSTNLLRSSLFCLSMFFELRCRYWEAINSFSQAVDALKTARKSVTGVEETRYFDSLLGLVTAYLGHHQYLMHYVEASESVAEALRLLENDESGKAQAQVIQAWIYQAQGQYQKAKDLFQKSMIAFQQEQDEWWYSLSISMLATINAAQGNMSESVALFEESLRRVEPGDLRLGIHIRTSLGYARFFLGDYPEAERLIQESLNLSDRIGNKRQAAYNHRILGQIALASGQNEYAKSHFQECVDINTRYGESPDLALALVHLGKGHAACLELEAAQEIFNKVTKIGKSLNVFYLVYWGLVNQARIIFLEGQPEKALEIMLLLQKYSVESIVVKEDAEHLLAELKGRLSEQQVEEAEERIKGRSIDSLLNRT